MEEKDIIDISGILNMLLQYKQRLIAIVLVTTLLAAGIAFLLPKQYESNSLVKVKSQKSGNGFSLQAASALALLGGGGTSLTQGYIEMMKSRSVLDPVIQSLDLPDKDKMDNVSFAKANLKMQNTKGSDLIEVTGIGRTPEEAQIIASGVVGSFKQLLTKMNQSEQSTMLKFLNERLDTSKREMEQAEKQLEGFRQQEKIYVPDQQAKAALEQVLGYDKRIAEVDVQSTTSQTKLQGINEQLQKQNIAITTYNIVDNLAIQQIRSQIINKQMSMVAMEQRYTDKHPNVILAKKEIEELNDKLKDEVDKSVQSGTITLNPIHANLLSQKVVTETELLVAQALRDAMGAKKAESEERISKLSSDSIAYIGLERKVAISREVYALLVKNYEQTRIQEAMENMDIQIVDEANLPQKPSAPRKMLITAIGGVVGMFFSFGYAVLLSTRRGRINSKAVSYKG